MKKRILIIVALVLVLALAANPLMAANPKVDITVSAAVVAATNSQAAWGIGTVEINNVRYFSATPTVRDDDYSTANNTGNVAITIKLLGTNFEGGAFDWTLANAAGDKIYSLYANSANGTGAYNIEVDLGGTNELIHEQNPGCVYAWSMNFTAPSAFDAADDGSSKSANVTLVVTKH